MMYDPALDSAEPRRCKGIAAACEALRSLLKNSMSRRLADGGSAGPSA